MSLIHIFGLNGPRELIARAIARGDVIPAAPSSPATRPDRKEGSKYGQTRALAARFVAGEFAADSINDVAARERVDPQSLYCAVGIIRRNGKPARRPGRPRRASA